MENLGGIDLTPANMNLQTQNAGGAIKFYLDPTMLARLQHAPGFIPVIINIAPLDDLHLFLGIDGATSPIDKVRTPSERSEFNEIPQ